MTLSALSNDLPAALSGQFPHVRTITDWSKGLPPTAYIGPSASGEFFAPPRPAGATTETEYFAQGDVERFRDDAVEIDLDGTVRLTATVDETLPGGFRSGSVYYGEGADEVPIIVGDFVQAPVKLQSIDRMWTALWLIERGTYNPPEIDVVEYWGAGSSTFHNCHYKWRWVNGSRASAGAFNPSITHSGLVLPWVLAGVHILDGAVDYYIDGTKIGRVNVPAGTSSDGRAEWTITYNLIVGGSTNNFQTPAAESFPLTVQMNPVKVWSPKPVLALRIK